MYSCQSFHFHKEFIIEAFRYLESSKIDSQGSYSVFNSYIVSGSLKFMHSTRAFVLVILYRIARQTVVLYLPACKDE